MGEKAIQERAMHFRRFMHKFGCEIDVPDMQANLKKRKRGKVNIGKIKSKGVTEMKAHF